MTNSNWHTSISKVQMLAELNDILARFYGANTTVSKKVARLPRQHILAAHQAVWYWRNDSLAEQVKTLNDWIDVAM